MHPTITNVIINQMSVKSVPARDVYNPMLAKNTGLKNIYELMSIFCSIYCASFRLQNTTPAIYAPVISAIPKNSSAQYAKISATPRP